MKMTMANEDEKGNTYGDKNNGNRKCDTIPDRDQSGVGRVSGYLGCMDPGADGNRKQTCGYHRDNNFSGGKGMFEGIGGCGETAGGGGSDPGGNCITGLYLSMSGM